MTTSKPSDEDDDLEEWVQEGWQKNIIYVNDDQWDELQRLLAEPPKDNPGLRELFRRANGTTYGGRPESRETEVSQENEEG